MDEKSYILIKKEYYDFNKKLSNNIKKTTISLENEECYLIEESWSNELNKYFEKYNNFKNKSEKKNKIDFFKFLPEKDPKFLMIFHRFLDV